MSKQFTLAEVEAEIITIKAILAKDESPMYNTWVMQLRYFTRLRTQLQVGA